MSSTKFDHTPVVITNLNDRSPVFHADPWLTREARWMRGESVQCNTIVYAGTSGTIGTNNGIFLPEAVVAPCGLVVRRRAPITPRDSRLSGTDTLNQTRGMVVQGVQLPRGHASRIGRPCKKCFQGAS